MNPISSLLIQNAGAALAEPHKQYKWNGFPKMHLRVHVSAKEI